MSAYCILSVSGSSDVLFQQAMGPALLPSAAILWILMCKTSVLHNIYYYGRRHFTTLAPPLLGETYAFASKAPIRENMARAPTAAPTQPASAHTSGPGVECWHLYYTGTRNPTESYYYHTPIFIWKASHFVAVARQRDLDIQP